MKFLYIVKKGDTVLSICEKFQMNPTEFIEKNKLQNYEIKAGDCVEILSGGKNV